MSASISVNSAWVLSDIVKAAGGDPAKAILRGDKLIMPDVEQSAAVAALGGYDDDVAQTAVYWAGVRAERDAKLAASDWTQVPDSPQYQNSAWLAYRQALRDITMQSAPVVWPSEPS